MTATANMKISNNRSKEFPVIQGLRQGCALACTLSKIYLEHVVKTGDGDAKE